MKTVKILLAVLAAVIIFSSCNKEYADPTITWTPDRVSHFVDFEDDSNYNLQLQVNFGAEAGLDDIKVWKYIYSGLDYVTVSMPAPEGYAGLTSFDYTFEQAHTVSDFTGGVTKIVYEFIVTDAQLQTTTKEYSILVIEAYSITFSVKDDFDNVITDAVVTFNGVTNEAGDYTFEYIEPGTYEYTVTKAGYAPVTVTDFVHGEEDATVDVVLVQNVSADWTGDIILALQGQTGWASYNGTPVTIYQSEEIGVAFTFTDAGIGRITTTSNCEGWVVVDDITGITSYAQIIAAYTGGTPVTTIDLNVDQRAYEAKYFVAKIGGNYKLVHYKFGHRSASTGNILGFQYKN